MESIVCNLCQGKTVARRLTTTDRVTGRQFDIVQCVHCGLRYTSPQPAPDEMATYYPGPARLSGPARVLRRRLRERRARWCAAGLSPGRALEIGCGDGWMLDALRRMGWVVAGTERSQRSAASPRRLGLDVLVEGMAGGAFAARSFDLVILWHVLEHLHDPLGTLIEVNRIVRPGGRLIVAVPNIESWQARVAGRRWFHLEAPRHLYHFAPQTLDAMLERAGFQVTRWSFWQMAYELRGWWELYASGAQGLAILATLLMFPIFAVASRNRSTAAMAVQASPV
ncbi:MAG: class I SAM-dependent methyltransferase [Chloroflexi bacterium]|nr:MAG: class I SAM-dependent methyltransferase [Chloroflexota bacterium]